MPYSKTCPGLAASNLRLGYLVTWLGFTKPFLVSFLVSPLMYFNYRFTLRKCCSLWHQGSSTRAKGIERFLENLLVIDHPNRMRNAHGPCFSWNLGLAKSKSPLTEKHSQQGLSRLSLLLQFQNKSDKWNATLSILSISYFFVVFPFSFFIFLLFWCTTSVSKRVLSCAGRREFPEVPAATVGTLWQLWPLCHGATFGRSNIGRFDQQKQAMNLVRDPIFNLVSEFQNARTASFPQVRVV